MRLTQDELADEICRLQRRGPSWRLLPASTKSPVFLEGRRLSGSCFLPFDVPFRVGEYCLTLRRDRSAEPDWEMYAGPAPPRLEDSEKPPVAEEEPDTPRTASLLLDARLSAAAPLEERARAGRSRAGCPTRDRRLECLDENRACTCAAGRRGTTPDAAERFLA